MEEVWLGRAESGWGRFCVTASIPTYRTSKVETGKTAKNFRCRFTPRPTDSIASDSASPYRRKLRLADCNEIPIHVRKVETSLGIWINHWLGGLGALAFTLWILFSYSTLPVLVLGRIDASSLQGGSGMERKSAREERWVDWDNA